MVSQRYPRRLTKATSWARTASSFISLDMKCASILKRTPLTSTVLTILDWVLDLAFELEDTSCEQDVSVAAARTAAQSRRNMVNHLNMEPGQRNTTPHCFGKPVSGCCQRKVEMSPSASLGTACRRCARRSPGRALPRSSHGLDPPSSRAAVRKTVGNAGLVRTRPAAHAASRREALNACRRGWCGAGRLHVVNAGRPHLLR